MLDVVEDRRFEMRVSRELLAQVDAWRRRQPDIPARATAIKRLIAAGLEAKRKPKPESKK